MGPDIEFAKKNCSLSRNSRKWCDDQKNTLTDVELTSGVDGFGNSNFKKKKSYRTSKMLTAEDEFDTCPLDLN